jgi:hypothetical protein
VRLRGGDTVWIADVTADQFNDITDFPMPDVVVGTYADFPNYQTGHFANVSVCRILRFLGEELPNGDC